MLSGVFKGHDDVRDRSRGRRAALPSASKRLTVARPVLRERADVERRSLRELAEAAAQDAAALGQQADATCRTRGE